MTNEQKARVRELIAAGVGYNRIAESLGLSANTVKSFCRRNTEVHPDDNREYNTCPQCGLPFTKTGRKKRFCSEACKTRWWNAHHDLYRNTSAVKVKCAHCGLEFTTYKNQKQKYCSHACYIAHRYGM